MVVLCATLMTISCFGLMVVWACNTFYIAEIQALLIGITLGWEAGFNKVICFSDSLHVIKLVAKEIPKFHIIMLTS